MAKNRRIYPLLAALTLFGILAGPARASQVVFGNLGSDGLGVLSTTANAQISSSTWLAQGFTVGGTNSFLDTVTIGISGTGNASVSLYSSSGGQPGSLLTSVTQSIIGASPTLQSFNFGGYSLTSAVSYWVVISKSDGGTFNWWYNDDGDFSSAQNASGWAPITVTAAQTKQSVDSGTSWANSGANRLTSLSITASSTAPAPEPIPEPGTWAAAALLIGAAAYVRWRRRPQAA